MPDQFAPDADPETPTSENGKAVFGAPFPARSGGQATSHTVRSLEARRVSEGHPNLGGAVPPRRLGDRPEIFLKPPERFVESEIPDFTFGHPAHDWAVAYSMARMRAEMDRMILGVTRAPITLKHIHMTIPCRVDPSMPPHTIAFLQDGVVVGLIRDVDGIDPSPQADGDSRDL